MKGEATLTKRVWISCLHELRSPNLSEEENKSVFGPCYRTHGHDYGIEICIRGPIDPKSGLICNRDLFEDEIQTKFIEKFDKTHLNHAFKNTTGELLAQEFFNYLKSAISKVSLVKVGVQETPKNYFSYSP